MADDRHFQIEIAISQQRVDWSPQTIDDSGIPAILTFPGKSLSQKRRFPEKSYDTPKKPAPPPLPP